MIPLGVGIHDSVEAARYHADALCDQPTLSRSGIVTLLNGTPADYAAKSPRLRNPAWPALETDSTPSTEIGDCVHAKVLGVGVKAIVGRLSDHLIPTGKNKGEPYKTWSGLAKEWKDDQKARGFVVLDEDENRLVTYLSEKLTHEIVKRYGASEWAARKVEQTMIWDRRLDDGATIWCRARADALLPSFTLDVKTSAFELSDRELGKQVATYGLDVQSVFYGDGRLLTYRGKVPFEFAYIRTEAPYTVRFYSLAEAGWDLNVTRMRIDKAAHIFGECVRTGVWPDHPLIGKPTPPPWFVAVSEAQAGLDGEIEA